jgi:hypothetical protein
MNFIQPFLNHIVSILCDHNPDLFSYIINWISFLIQKFGSKTETALIIIGEQGTGKTKFLLTLSLSYLECMQYKMMNNIRNIIGRINRSIENKILIVGMNFKVLATQTP